MLHDLHCNTSKTRFDILSTSKVRTRASYVYDDDDGDKYFGSEWTGAPPLGSEGAPGGSTGSGADWGSVHLLR